MMPTTAKIAFDGLTGATFFAKYQRQMGTTASECATMDAAEERGAVPLADICDLCERLDTNAELRDVAGFQRGWALCDGTYRLS